MDVISTETDEFDCSETAVVLRISNLLSKLFSVVKSSWAEVYRRVLVNLVVTDRYHSVSHQSSSNIFPRIQLSSLLI